MTSHKKGNRLFGGTLIICAMIIIAFAFFEIGVFVGGLTR